MGNGKRKGSSFEREVAKYLTNWASGQLKELWYWRSPGSGMLAKIANQKEMTGDIVPLKEEAKVLTNIFSIEIKTGYIEADPLKHLKKTKNETIRSFWDQCITDARTGNKSGMLIFRKKGSKSIVGIEGTIFEKWRNLLSSINHIVLYYANDLPDLVLMDMEDFFEIIKPNQLK